MWCYFVLFGVRGLTNPSTSDWQIQKGRMPESPLKGGQSSSEPGGGGNCSVDCPVSAICSPYRWKRSGQVGGPEGSSGAEPHQGRVGLASLQSGFFMLPDSHSTGLICLRSRDQRGFVGEPLRAFT